MSSGRDERLYMFANRKMLKGYIPAVPRKGLSEETSEYTDEDERSYPFTNYKDNDNDDDDDSDEIPALAPAELHKREIETRRKVRTNWEALIERLSKYNHLDQGDVLDLETLEIVEDRGHLKSLTEKSAHHLWHEEFDDDKEIRRETAANRKNDRIVKANALEDAQANPEKDDLMLLSTESSSINKLRMRALAIQKVLNERRKEDSLLAESQGRPMLFSSRSTMSSSPMTLSPASPAIDNASDSTPSGATISRADALRRLLGSNQELRMYPTVLSRDADISSSPGNATLNIEKTDAHLLENTTSRTDALRRLLDSKQEARKYPRAWSSNPDIASSPVSATPNSEKSDFHPLENTTSRASVLKKLLKKRSHNANNDTLNDNTQESEQSDLDYNQTGVDGGDDMSVLVISSDEELESRSGGKTHSEQGQGQEKGHEQEQEQEQNLQQDEQISDNGDVDDEDERIRTHHTKKIQVNPYSCPEDDESEKYFSAPEDAIEANKKETQREKVKEVIVLSSDSEAEEEEKEKEMNEDNNHVAHISGEISKMDINASNASQTSERKQKTPSSNTKSTPTRPFMLIETEGLTKSDDLARYTRLIKRTPSKDDDDIGSILKRLSRAKSPSKDIAFTASPRRSDKLISLEGSPLASRKRAISHDNDDADDDYDVIAPPPKKPSPVKLHRSAFLLADILNADNE